MRLGVALLVALATFAGAARAACSIQDLLAALPAATVLSEVVSALERPPIPQGNAPVGTARRRLQEQPAPERPVFRACPRILSPVCSTAGEEFPNDCVATNRGAQVACRGPCPCGALASSAGETGPVDPVNGPCPRIWSPVCGTDGATHASKCVAGGADKVACEGPCPCGAGDGGKRELLQAAVACPAIWAPVCGTNNVTYGSDCVAGGAGTTVACTGECPCAPRPCPLIWAPVCGADNVTYGSACAAGDAPVACEGECPCPAAGPASGSGSGSGDAAVCMAMVDPVCGTDGLTYNNKCVAEASGATVACAGQCPCPDVLAELSQRGGLLLAPADDALAEALEAYANTTGASGALVEDGALLRGLLARHVILAKPGKAAPQPSADGTEAQTAAGETVWLFGDAGKPTRVVTAPPADDDIAVEAQASEPGCAVVAWQIAKPLSGPPKAGEDGA